MSRDSLSQRLGITLTGIFIFLVLLGTLSTAHAAASNADCLMCHSAATLHKTSGARDTSLYVNPQDFASSSHGKLNCIDCHADLKDQPLKHETKVKPVNCAGCHEKKGWNPNTIHYSVSAAAGPPACKDCHGNHYIKPKTDKASMAYPVNAEANCARCHAKSKAIRTYQHGVHSQLGANGRPLAGCTDCHEPHTGQPAGTPMSCAKCHAAEYKDYATSTHGKAYLAGNTDTPTCVTCHGTHDALAKTDIRSTVNPANVPATCAKCHDSQLMDAYHLPTDRLKTYRHSYHGVANKYGEAKVATCASCHQAHHVLPASDPASSISKANLQKTCGACHKGITQKVAQGQVHVEITGKNKDLLYWVSTAFKWLTIGTMLALVGHIMLDLNCKFRHYCRGRRSDR